MDRTLHSAVRIGYSGVRPEWIALEWIVRHHNWALLMACDEAPPRHQPFFRLSDRGGAESVSPSPARQSETATVCVGCGRFRSCLNTAQVILARPEATVVLPQSP